MGTVSQWADDVLLDLHKADPKITDSTADVNDLELWASQEQDASSWAADENNVLGVRGPGGANPSPAASFSAGAQLTANTLENGLYGNILEELGDNADNTDFASAVIQSPWSGGTYLARGGSGGLKGAIAVFLDRTRLPGSLSAPPIDSSGTGAPATKTATSAKSTKTTPAKATLTSFPGGGIDPLNWPSDIFGAFEKGATGAADSAASSVWSAVEPFLAKSFFVVGGLALIGVGLYKLASPTIKSASDAVVDRASQVNSVTGDAA